VQRGFVFLLVWEAFDRTDDLSFVDGDGESCVARLVLLLIEFGPLFEDSSHGIEEGVLPPSNGDSFTFLALECK